MSLQGGSFRQKFEMRSGPWSKVGRSVRVNGQRLQDSDCRGGVFQHGCRSPVLHSSAPSSAVIPRGGSLEACGPAHSRQSAPQKASGRWPCASNRPVHPALLVGKHPLTVSYHAPMKSCQAKKQSEAKAQSEFTPDLKSHPLDADGRQALSNRATVT